MKKPEAKRPKQPGRPVEFSKAVLALVMVVFFLAAIFGAYIILSNPEQLDAFFVFVGGPTATAIGFYAWKARKENLLKIKQAEKAEEKEDGI